MLPEREWQGRNSWNSGLQRSLVNNEVGLEKRTSYCREISLPDLIENSLPMG